MTRFAYAARTLSEQVREKFPKAIVAVDEEPDGFGVIRSLRFDAETSKWLEPIMQAAADDRIASVDDSTAELGVTFVNGIKADNANRFLLKEVDAILNDPEEAPPNDAPHVPDKADPKPDEQGESHGRTEVEQELSDDVEPDKESKPKKKASSKKKS